MRPNVWPPRVRPAHFRSCAVRRPRGRFDVAAAPPVAGTRSCPCGRATAHLCEPPLVEGQLPARYRHILEPGVVSAVLAAAPSNLWWR